MSWKHLGEVFDIHGGGLDLIFPHHENEIAQSRCAFGHDAMANVWMHNGFVLVDGHKMAKSTGNFVTVDDLLRNGYGDRKWSGDAIRLAMLRAHYRQPVDWTAKALTEADRMLERWGAKAQDADPNAEPLAGAMAALRDDINTPAMLAALHDGFERDPDGSLAALRLIGFFGTGAAKTKAPLDEVLIERLMGERAAARDRKDWAASDRLRAELGELGVEVEDKRGEPSTWRRKRVG